VKVQIIYLDPEDDHTSAREKLRWTKSPRVVLVWPGRGRVLSRMLDVKLLQRQAGRQGTQIGFVTHDPDVVHLAGELGIPVFETVDEIESGRWHVRPLQPAPPERQRPDIQPEQIRHRQAYPRKASTPKAWARYLAFSLGIIVPLAAILVLLPSAEIVVSPETRQRRQIILFTLSEADSRQPVPGQLEIQRLTVQVDGSLRISTTGTSSQPENPARGMIELTNVSTSTVTLAAGARLLPAGQGGPTFETLSRAVVFPESSQSIEVVAIEPGPAGNLPADTTWAIEGPAGLSLQAVNPEPTTGGSLATRSSVSADDLLTLETELEAELLDAAREELQSRLTSQQTLIAASLGVTRVLQSSYDHPAGEVADSVALSMLLEVSGTALDDLLLQEALAQEFSESLPAGWWPVPGSLDVIETLYSAPAPSEPARLRVEFSSLSFRKPDQLGIIRALRLRPVEESVRLLEAGSVDVELVASSLNPGWLPVFPPFAFQFDIRLPWDSS